MSNVLFSWVQPKSGAPIQSWKDLHKNWFLALCCVLMIILLVRLPLSEQSQWEGIGTQIFVLWMLLPPLNTTFRIIRPTYQFLTDGIRIKGRIFSEFYRWEEIEYYVFVSKTNELLQLHFQARRGRRRRVAYQVIDFDRSQADENALRAILEQRLAGKGLHEMTPHEFERVTSS